MQVRDEAGPGVSAEDRLDHARLDWSTVRASTFVLRQRLRYDYPGPIRDLRHRLMVVPPLRHGDQRRIEWRVDVSGADTRIRERRDRFGNLSLDVRARRVAAAIEFEVETVVARAAGDTGTLLPQHVLVAPCWLQPSTLTHPDAVLREAAAQLSSDGCRGLELARRITAWTHRALTYADGVTTVHTTAGEAVALGRGVCQDYAHVMLALCRLCNLPARYVSGHLLGEGGSHAWVEVLMPAPGRDRARAVPFDATHNRQSGLSYLTVAVGRDYADVAPTSGTYSARYTGQLSVTKRLSLSSVEAAGS